MIVTIEKPKTINELITSFIQKQDIKTMISNLDEAFLFFSMEKLATEEEHSDICWTYSFIKDFLFSLNSNECNYEKSIEKLFANDDLDDIINKLSNFFYYSLLSINYFEDNEKEKISFFLTFKNIKDFLFSLNPYYKKHYKEVILSRIADNEVRYANLN